MAHAQKPDFFFPRNGRVHSNRWGCQFSRLLAAKVCASALVMLDILRSEVAWEYWLPTPFASFPFTSPPVRHCVPSCSERVLSIIPNKTWFLTYTCFWYCSPKHLRICLEVFGSSFKSMAYICSYGWRGQRLHLHYSYSNSMEQSHFWEGNRFSASQIPRILWNPSLITAFSRASHLSLSWASSIQSMIPSPFHLLKIHLNIILICAWFFQVASVPQVSPPKPCMHLSSTPYVLHAHPSHSSRFEQPDNIWWGVQIIEILIM